MSAQQRQKTRWLKSIAKKHLLIGFSNLKRSDWEPTVFSQAVSI